MLNRPVGLAILFFCVSFISTAQGGDSSQASPGLLPFSVNSTSTQTMTGYPSPSLPAGPLRTQAGLTAFLSNPLNLCPLTGTPAGNAPCFVQYTVTGSSTSPLPGAFYKPTPNDRTSLTCPDGYVPAAYMGDGALDVLHTLDKIYYYGSTTSIKITKTQYAAAVLGGTADSCTAEASPFKYFLGCSWSGCPGSVPAGYSETLDPTYEVYVKKLSTSFIASAGYKAALETFTTKYTYPLIGMTFNRCDAVPPGSALPPVPPSYHSSCLWYNVGYFYVDCTLPAGYYKYDPATPLSNRDPSHIPSTVICVKPTKLIWQPTPSS